MSTHTFFEYGYRLAGGREVWAEDHGTDGTWIPYDDATRVGSVYLDAGIDAVASIELALQQAGVEGAALRRQVVVLTGPKQQHAGGDEWRVVAGQEQYSLDRLVAESQRLREESQQERAQHEHKPVQHRDGKPPWCNDCGLTEEQARPVMPERRVEDLAAAEARFKALTSTATGTEAWQDPAWGPRV